jgi:hypothetical protein
MALDENLGVPLTLEMHIRVRDSQPRTMSWDIFTRPCGTDRWRMLTQD